MSGRGRTRPGTGAQPATASPAPATARGRDAPKAPLVPGTSRCDDGGPGDAMETRPRREDVLLLAGLALVVVMAILAGLLVLRVNADDRVEQARAEARAAAEISAVTLLSYDHRRLDRDFAAAKKLLTGGFADDYASTAESVVRPTAEQVKAVVTAEVVSSSVDRADENRAVVLLFVDQTTTSTRVDGPQVDLNRVRMRLVRSGGQWLVSGADAL